MKIDLSHFRQTFLQESAEHVASMEAGLLQLRSSPEDTELLNGIFRSAHSIKGGAGSFGMESLARFTHSLENLLDRLRSHEMQASEEVIGLLLQSVDILRGMLAAEPDAAMPAVATTLVERMAALAPPDAQGTASAAGENPAAAVQVPASNLYRVEFRPDRELFASGTNPLVLLRNLAELGTVKQCHLHADDLPPLGELDPAQCYLAWTLEMESAAGEVALREVFEFVEHLAEIRIGAVDAAPQSNSALTPNSTTAPEPIAPSPSDGARLFVERRKSAVADRRQSGTPDRRQSSTRAAASGDSSSIRVATEKVDRLIDLVGELVIAHVMTAQMVDDFEPSCLPKLRESVAAMERNTRELHERVMGIRMLPVGTLFQRYSRTVYDIAQATGKQIRLETAGEETEIDKSMLELLGDPLTHLVRNAADHGIEAAEVRAAAGKPAEGVIRLKSCYRSGRVVIEISDDGAGIDPEKVRRKAVERGLMSADTQISDEQLRALIFEPGFSTKEEISDLSGRGVGMDVVKRNVQQLNGTVAVESEKGVGSTVTIELPLTLSILDGLLVRVQDRTLVLPLLSVIETVPLRDDQVTRLAERGEVIVIREESIPLLRLSRYLRLMEVRAAGLEDEKESADRRLTVIVQAGRRKIGLVVDELLGQQQVVVKSLERNLHRVDGLMGATILGDGRVAPIVDVAGIASLDLFSLHAPAALGPQLTSPAPSARAN